MNSRTPSRVAIALQRGAVLLAILALAGCDRQQVTTRRVPKDSANAPVHPDELASGPTGPADFHAGMSMTRTRPTWTLPEGWQEVPPASQMRVASFVAVGKSGRTNDISVIPMSAGTPENDVVLIWRQELQLPMNGQGSGQESEPIDVGSDHGKLFNLVSEQPLIDGTAKARTLVGVVPHGETAWYFKMTGEDASVLEQKPAFIQFLKSVSFANEAASPQAFPLLNPNDKPAATAAAVSVPADWKPAAPSQFITEKYVLTGAGNATAEVTVSVLGGEAGGVLGNVNRWRGQLSLPPVSESDLAPQLKSLDTARGKATLVDLSGTDRSGKKTRMIGVVLPETGQTAFYKLTGDPAVVEAQLAAFTKFVQAAKY